MVIENFGGVEVFQLREIPTPVPQKDELLVRVAATSVNPLDTKIRQGLFKNLLPPLPGILQGDFAGTVERIGRDVSEFKVGDNVYGFCGGFQNFPGALAEFISIKASWVSGMPANLSFREAAALPLASITAWMALREKSRSSAGESILIHGGTGGVGHVAVQLAKSLGLKVFTTVSNEAKASLAQELGADVCINYRTTSPLDYLNHYTGGSGFPHIFDTVGGETLKSSLECVAPLGEIITIAARSTQDLTALHVKGASLHVVFMLAPLLYAKSGNIYGAILGKIRKLVESGQMRPLLDPVQFSIEEVAQAHDRLQGGKVTGKIVLDGL